MDNNLQEFRFSTGVKVYSFCHPVPVWVNIKL